MESTAVDILQALQYSYASLDSLCDVAKVIISQSLDVDNSVLVLNYTIAGDEVVNSTNFEASQNKSFVDDSYSACDESHRNNSNNNIWTFDSMKNSTSEVLETFAGVVSSTAVDAVGYLVHFLFNFVHDFIVVPVRSTSDEPSIGVHIAICLLILSGVGAVEFKSAKTKRRTLFFLYACMWLYLIALESHQRARLVKRSSMKAVNSYLKLKIHHTSSSLKRTVISNDTVDEPTPQKKRFWNFFNLKVGDQSIDQSTSPNDQDYTLFEETVWGNALLSSIWYVDNGGIGPYISDTLAEVINAELSLVPPGVANLHLRKFTLGSSPPLIKGMRAFVERDDVNYTMSDLQGHIVSNSSGNTTINDGRAPSPSSETINSSLWQVSTFSSLVNLGRSQIRNGSDELEPMASRLSNASIQSNSTNTDFTESGSTQETLENYLKSNNSTDGHFKDYAVWKYNVTNNGSTNPSSREIANDNMYDEDPHSEDDGIDPELMMDNLSDSDTQYQRWFSYSIAKLFKSQLPKWAYNSLLGIVDSSERNRTSAITFEQLRNFESQSDFLSHSESDRLVLDIDFVYCSKDMDIVVALRSPNVKSALPEASFRLSELMFSGKLRINSSLTADFPFLGNASVRIDVLKCINFFRTCYY